LERHPTTLKHLDIVARLREDLVAFLNTELLQRMGHGVDPLLQLVPSPLLVTLNEADALRKLLRALVEQLPQVHDLRRIHAFSKILK
jgi:hypothetical protein